MNREQVLCKLGIRLSHLAESANADLKKDLETLRQSLRGGIKETELNRISERLARHLLLDPASSGTPPPSLGKWAAEIAQSIKALPLDDSCRARITALADQLLDTHKLDRQLQTLNEVFQLLPAATSAAPSKKSAPGGLRRWLDKKGGADTSQLTSFLQKSSRLLNQAIQHVELLNGNTSDTRLLKELMEHEGSVDAMGEAIEGVINLLKAHGDWIEEERSTTQNFLGTLRERLNSVEEVIHSVITDGDESLARAVTLGQQMGDDVRVIGQAVKEDDLELLRQTVDAGLSKLSTKLSSYLDVEKHRHQESRERVEDLNRKISSMETEARELRGEIKQKQDMAFKDALTGVYNRAGYEQRISEELARSRRSKSPLSLVFVDCNKFKQINDTFGHTAGDVVLVQVAAALAARARATDIIARYGGDEFIALLPDTPAEGAEHFARNACEKILGAGFNANGQPLEVSISCGITQALADDTPESMVKRADAAMYLAKKATGAKVVIK